MNDLLGLVGGGHANGHGPQEDIEMGTRPTAYGDREREMQGFFSKVEDVKTSLSEIKLRQRQIQQMHEKSKTLVRSKEIQRHREEMQDTINEVNKLAHTIKARLEALDKENEDMSRKPGQGSGSASERTRTSITAGLKKKFKDQMAEFTDLRSKIHEEYREVVERRVYTVTGQKMSEEDIDRMIETGESEAIFQKAILEQGRGRVLDTLAEIQERHRAVKDLEQGLMELHQIFLDMAVLVEAQGEMLDNIEKQVARAGDYVQSGTVALQQAKEYQKKKRRWMCWAIIVLLIVIAIVVVVVIKPWNIRK